MWQEHARSCNRFSVRFGYLRDLFVDYKLDDAALIRLVSQVEPGNLFLLEDVDAAFSGRVKGEGQEGGVTMSGLLNIIDSITAQEGSLFLMTTNHPEKLDKALTRLGRVHGQYFIGYPGQHEAAILCRHLLGLDISEEQITAIANHFAQEQNRILNSRIRVRTVEELKEEISLRMEYQQLLSVVDGICTEEEMELLKREQDASIDALKTRQSNEWEKSAVQISTAELQHIIMSHRGNPIASILHAITESAERIIAAV